MKADFRLIKNKKILSSCYKHINELINRTKKEYPKDAKRNKIN